MRVERDHAEDEAGQRSFVAYIAPRWVGMRGEEGDGSTVGIPVPDEFGEGVNARITGSNIAFDRCLPLLQKAARAVGTTPPVQSYVSNDCTPTMVTRSLAQRDDFRSLIDHLDGVTIWIVSEPGEFEYISSGFEEIWGIPPEEIEDDVSRLIESIHPDDRERVKSIIHQSREDRVSEEAYEARIVRPDGEVRWGLTRQFPIRDSNDNLTEIVGVTTDITGEKRREQELETLNRVIRHDIRNDVSIVLGWAEMLEEHVDDTGEEYRRQIVDAGNHVVELTEIARDYAESVVGQDEIESTPVSLPPVLDDEVTLRRESYPSAEFEIVGEIPDVEVMANGMLGSVFRNLLNNAVQHNDKDDPVVEISCEVGDENAVIRVADNGPGIPDERKEAVFGKEEKGIESSGSGIGLYLVRTLVEGYGGDVGVEDNSPAGSVFTVRLPIAD